MQYTTSEQLARYLKQYGLAEKTKQTFPEDFDQILRDGYDPQEHRRIFKFGQHFVVTFEQEEIRSEQGFYKFRRQALSPGELSSILCYLKFPTHLQTAIRNRCHNILDIEREYRRIQSQPTTDRSITDKKIVEVYGNIMQSI